MDKRTRHFYSKIARSLFKRREIPAPENNGFKSFLSWDEVRVFITCSGTIRSEYASCGLRYRYLRAPSSGPPRYCHFYAECKPTIVQALNAVHTCRPTSFLKWLKSCRTVFPRAQSIEKFSRFALRQDFKKIERGTREELNIALQYCRAKEERRMNILELPNFLQWNVYFLGKIWMFFFEIFRDFRWNSEQNYLKNWKKNIHKFPRKFMFYQREVRNAWRFIRRFSLARQNSGVA